MSTQKKVFDIVGKEQVEFIAAQQAIKSAEVLRVVVIDSGFGGLSVCREIEREATKNACGASIQIIYMNAAVQVGLGYNNLKCYDDKITLFNETLLLIVLEMFAHYVVAFAHVVLQLMSCSHMSFHRSEDMLLLNVFAHCFNYSRTCC